MWIIDRSVDPVSMRQGYSPGKVELRIARERPGQARYAHLTASQARKVAYSLLAAAEKAQISPHLAQHLHVLHSS